MIDRTQNLILLHLIIILPVFAFCQQAGPFQATGIKIGEVSSTKAIIWTRLTKLPYRVNNEAPMPKALYQDPETGEWMPRKSRWDREVKVVWPEGHNIETIEGAVPGEAGEVSVLYKRKQKKRWQNTAWMPVNPRQDFTRQFQLDKLKPGSTYEIRVQARTGKGAELSSVVEGKFNTAPKVGKPAKIVFTVTTGQGYGDQDLPGKGFKIYEHMLALDPDFFVHTGDILYYDNLAKTAELARWHWARTFSLPTNLDFHKQVSSYFEKDDHDTWMNDCWPGQETRFMGEFTFEEGLQIFKQEVPMGESTYRTFRWGKDLQIWLVEGRDFRSPNNMPDGPDKTIWGKEQKEWFKRTVRESDATFKLLISPTPVVGPDRSKKSDNHSNRVFKHEGDEIRAFISKQKNMYVVCGDRHWQYVSQHAETGVREYSCGPASDGHAGGWKSSDRYPEHVYLNVIGGFLSGTVDRIDGKPALIFRHHNVEGKVLFEDQLLSDE